MTNGKTVSTGGNTPNASWRKIKFEHWRSLGIGLLPLRSEPAKQRKEPAIDAWNQYVDNPAQSEILEGWANTSTNYGVIVGSKLVVFDFESFEAAAKTFARLGLKDSDIYAVKTGKGIHAYFKRNYTIKPQRYHDSTGKLVVEIRAGAQYVVGAGSKHPSGAIYEEIGLEEPTELAEAGFQKFTDAFVQLGWNGSGKKADDEKPAVVPRTDGIVPPHIKKTIELGAAKGSGRNDARFVLLLSLAGAGVPLDRAKEHLLQYNKNSDEPDDEAKVIAQVEQVYQGCTDGTYAPIVQGGVKKKGGWNIVPFGELFSRIMPSINWVVKGLIPQGGITVVGGKRSSTKTWLTLFLVHAIATGNLFLGKYEVCRKNILYIDAENGETEIKKRTELIGMDAGLLGIDFVFFPNMKLDGDCDDLRTYLAAHPGTVVIIDSFRRVLGIDENDAGEVNNVLVSVLRPMIQEFGATFILLHHMRKGTAGGSIDYMDELRGSSEIVNYADSVIIMERARANNDIVTVRHVKNRGGAEQPPFKLEIDATETSFGFKFIENAEDITSQLEAVVKAIDGWIFANSKTEFKTHDVVEALKSGFSSRTVERGLESLVSDGKLTKPMRGKYVVVATPLTKWTDGGEAPNEAPLRDSGIGATSNPEKKEQTPSANRPIHIRALPLAETPTSKLE